MPERAGAAAVVQDRARGLRGVLEHRHAERLDLLDGRDVAEQVHGDHGLGASASCTALTVSGVMHIVSGSTSQKTGRAPVCGIASADA